VTQQTWGGRGKRPQWIHDALAAGKSLADYAI
jgi:DNA-binding protein H-NS